MAQVIQVPINFNTQINLIAFFFSAVAGAVFGYMPARQSARLSPISLRHE